jgi:transposase
LYKKIFGILYFDYTNYLFEPEQEDGLKHYSYSKEHRPNPVVQMGLFMDGDSISLFFNISKGNMLVTLKPLAQKILDDFKLS